MKKLKPIFIGIFIICILLTGILLFTAFSDDGVENNTNGQDNGDGDENNEIPEETTEIPGIQQEDGDTIIESNELLNNHEQIILEEDSLSISQFERHGSEQEQKVIRIDNNIRHILYNMQDKEIYYNGSSTIVNDSGEYNVKTDDIVMKEAISRSIHAYVLENSEINSIRTIEHDNISRFEYTEIFSISLEIEDISGFELQSGFINVNDGTAEYIISENGLILNSELTVSSDNRFEYTYQINGFEDINIEEPDWVDDAISSKSALDANLDQNNNWITIHHQDFSDIPEGTTVDITSTNNVEQITIPKDVSPGDTIYFYKFNDNWELNINNPPDNIDVDILTQNYVVEGNNRGEQLFRFVLTS